MPPLPAVDDSRVFTVRTLEDAVALRSLLDAGSVGRAVVVGAGYIGLEIAEALHARGVAVTVVERLARVLPTLDEPIAALVEEHVRAHVDLRLGAPSRRTRCSPRSTARRGRGRARGVRPGGGIAGGRGRCTGPRGALTVDDRMRTSLPDVFAAGDCVAPLHRVIGSAGVRAARPGGQQDRTGRGHGRRGRRRDVRRASSGRPW